MPSVTDAMVPIALSRSEQEIVYQQNDFSLELYKKLVQRNNGKNFMVSPFSLSIAMSMLANGAEGEAKYEITGALGFDTDEIEQVNALNNRLVKELLEVDNTTELSLANAIWLDEKIQVKEDFISRNKDSYSAEIHVADFSDKDVVLSQINSWVKEKTKGVVPPFVDNSFLADKIFLTNALYFNGIWNVPFEKSLTEEREFFNADGSESAPVTMLAKDYYFSGTYDTNGAAWVNLRYGNMAYEMTLIIPDGGISLAEYLGGISGDDFKQLTDRGMQTEYCGNVQLPKFELYSEADFSPVLEQFGMNKIQTGEYVYSAISDSPIGIGAIMQKAVVKCDERGTEASSVTFNKWDISPGDFPQADVIVNRPFGFMIRESSTGTVLFVGCVNNL